MVLWVSKPRVMNGKPGHAIRLSRWTLEVTGCERGRSVSLFQETFCVDEATADAWTFGPRYVSVTLRPTFKWGSAHAWYDGNNCGWHVGFATVGWDVGRRCWRCEADLL